MSFFGCVNLLVGCQFLAALLQVWEEEREKCGSRCVCIVWYVCVWYLDCCVGE
jgi:hypothetical protein